MYICGTKKMLDKLKVSPKQTTKQEELDELFSWHANLVKFDRRQSIVLMNDESKYTIILYGLLAKDFSQLPQIFREAIRKVWRKEGIEESLIDGYLATAGEVQFVKTKNRNLISSLNQACLEVGVFFESMVNRDEMIQTALSMKESRLLAKMKNSKYAEPFEVLNKQLKQFADDEES